jgi:hypothetical protein
LFVQSKSPQSERTQKAAWPENLTGAKEPSRANVQNERTEGGHRSIDHFVTGTGREEEFLAEARTVVRFFWKGFDSMLAL